jgi:hypothetical protein
MKFSAITIIGATAVVVAAQPHAHVHRHAARHGSPIEKRVDATDVVEGPAVTVYRLNGADIPAANVEEGIRNGIYILVSDSSTSPSATPTPTPSPSTSAKALEFFEKKPSTSSVAPVTPTPSPVVPSSTPTPTPTPSPTPTPTPTPSPSPSASPVASAAPATGNGVKSEFPSGKVKCSEFPSAYGAIYIDYLNLNGYIGIQQVPNYTPGDAQISYIATGIAGDNCGPNMFCSYACPAGYQKSQWPTAQGNTGQSIGGIYCNSNGFLELSNTDHSTLCIPGTGEVKVKNTLSQNVAICRTDYPGTESETVPLNTQPGQTYEVACPDANKYYHWGNAATSAQYYINPAGAPVEDACRWNSAGSNLGNWAPVNLGVGKGPAGTTYISMFPNKPTNPDGKLNFRIAIEGDVSGDCQYHDGTFWNNGVQDDAGCTVSSGKTQFRSLLINHRSWSPALLPTS